MKSLAVIALLASAAALSACDDKAPKPELETRPPATGGMTHPAPTPEPAPASQPGEPTPVPMDSGKQ